MRVIAKYGLLQLPGQVSLIVILFACRLWVDIPSYLMWGLIGIWVGKDLILFPFVWRSYDPSQQSDRFRMAGRKGVALTRLNPDGYVRVRSERWRAEADKSIPIEKGDTVCVDAADGLRLTVSPCGGKQPR